MCRKSSRPKFWEPAIERHTKRNEEAKRGKAALYGQDLWSLVVRNENASKPNHGKKGAHKTDNVTNATLIKIRFKIENLIE